LPQPVPGARRLAAPLRVSEPTDELAALQHALLRAQTRSERAAAANRLFQEAHALWQSGILSAVDYRLALAEVDAAAVEEEPPEPRPRTRRV
jgi:hypothetical protein